jgi:hypothetical protein
MTVPQPISTGAAMHAVPHGNQPPQALQELAADTGACLAYTATAGWHLLPDPQFVLRARELDRREARQTTPPPASSVPTMASLAGWLDTVNAALLEEQGYRSRT